MKIGVTARLGTLSFATLAVAALLVGTPSPALAQSAAGPLHERYEVVLGGFFSTLDTTMAVSGTAGDAGTLVDFEQDLGAPDSDNVFRASASMRFGKHQFRAGYFQVSREGTIRLRRTINWGDETFEVGADVTSSFESRFPEVDYTYWFVSSPRVALGGTIGATLFGVEADLSASTLGGRTTGTKVDTTTFVPLFGGEFRGLIAPWLMAKVTGGYINDFQGSQVWTGSVAIEPHIYKPLWAGVSFSTLNFSVSKEGPLNFVNGEADYGVAGVQAYLRLAF
jgi:hypothetical protein